MSAAAPHMRVEKRSHNGFSDFDVDGVLWKRSHDSPCSKLPLHQRDRLLSG